MCKSKFTYIFVYKENHLLCRCVQKSLSVEKKIPRFDKIDMVSLANLESKEVLPKMDNNSLAHTKWRCKYHIVFAPKYRRKEIYGEKKKEIGKILRMLCEWKGVEIIEANACKDHIHILVSIPPKISVSGFVGFLRGKSSLMIFERFSNLRYKYGNRHFWCRGYLL